MTEKQWRYGVISGFSGGYTKLFTKLEDALAKVKERAFASHAKLVNEIQSTWNKDREYEDACVKEILKKMGTKEIHSWENEGVKKVEMFFRYVGEPTLNVGRMITIEEYLNKPVRDRNLIANTRWWATTQIEIMIKCKRHYDEVKVEGQPYQPPKEITEESAWYKVYVIEKTDKYGCVTKKYTVEETDIPYNYTFSNNHINIVHTD